MREFKVGMWLAGLVVGCGLVVPLACGPVQEEETQGGGMNEPSLAVQEQESHGGHLGSALGKPVATGTTAGKTNDVSSNCAGANTAPDIAYTWTPPFTGTFKLTTEGSALDTVLTVHPVNNSTSITGCNDDEPGGNTWSSLTLNLVFGTSYTIVVDGFGKSAGPIELNISAPGYNCGGSCTTPPSTCHQSSGTCEEGICVYPFKAFGASCDDGNFCSLGEICDGAGTCGAGTARTCNSPPNPQCQQSTGTCSGNQCNYPLKATGTTCDDGNSCTVNDVCGSTGTCSGSTLSCNTPPDAQCYQTNGTCSNGSCSYLPMPSGTPCNDGKSCTVNDVCNGSGTCGGASACNSPPGQCYQAAGVCSGSSCAYVPKAAGTACNDGQNCTVNDVCNGSGSCGGSTVACSLEPSNECREFIGCTASGQCEYQGCPEGTSCKWGRCE